MVDVVPKTRRTSVCALGFRRIEFVRLIVDKDGTTAAVTGVTHRLPRTIRIPLRTANALIEAGVPSRVEARRQADAAQSRRAGSDR